MAKRIALTLSEEQLKLIRSLKGLGKKDAEIAKNIFLAYVAQKGILQKFNKRESQ